MSMYGWTPDFDRPNKHDPWPEVRSFAEGLTPGSPPLSLVPGEDENVQDLINELIVAHLETQAQNEELRQAHWALEATREHYFELFHCAPLGSLVLDGKGIIRESNLAAEDLLQLPSRKLRNRPLGRFVQQEDHGAYAKCLAWSVQGGASRQCRVRLRQGGRFVPVAVALRRPMGAQPEAPLLANLLEMDGTGAERAPAPQVRLEPRMAGLTGLARRFSQETTRAMASIRSLVESQMVHAPPGSALARDLEAIRELCRMGRGFALGLAGFAKERLATVQSIDLNALVCDEMTLLKGQGAAVRVAPDLDPGLRLIPGDPSALATCLIHLCANALEAMPGGGTLGLATRNETEDAVLLEVSDTGAGMAPEVLERAAEPLFSTRRHRNAAGLGLSLVYGAMRAHHGRMELESALGEGTTVRLHFSAVRSV
ncbi:sensor histidine kinase [Mesoterricola silvestris]|uniref:histidine kinase n=1 Tax=Mesoterricola silvestris TaxID=2927979 RepID=A0AA48GFQ6_9BACT|nr:ATP-binding protein [Mesoterricola silvestris]BDU71861.1 hypothetical protein METEAL_10350 [Mesoterricola silvestris]